MTKMNSNDGYPYCFHMMELQTASRVLWNLIGKVTGRNDWAKYLSCEQPLIVHHS
jgi:hypothetical protein